MTSAAPTPYWPATEDWAGFLLVIVPVGHLPVSGQELCRQVRAQIETDPVLYDLVTVRLAPPLESGDDWYRAFAAGVVQAALPDRHYFAPRGVIGVVAVAANPETLRNAFDDLRELSGTLRLWTRTFGAGVRLDPRAGVAPSVAQLADTVNALVAMYDEQPQLAMAEPVFLDRIGALIEQGYLDRSAVAPDPLAGQQAGGTASPAWPTLDDRAPEPAPVQPVPVQRPPLADQPVHGDRTPFADQPVYGDQHGHPDRPVQAERPAHPDRSVQPDRPAYRDPYAPADRPARPDRFEQARSESRQAEPIPVARPSREPMPRVETRAELRAPDIPAGRQPKPLQKAVMYDGTELVTVDRRTAVQRLTRQHRTDADCMDELARAGDAVGLVHVVFVPDDGVVQRSVAKRRNAIALELDQLLATVELDAMTDRPVRIAVEVLSATSPLVKHGVLRVAGTLTESALPKVEIEYFSVAETVEPLLDAARRTSRALRARGVDVVSQHFVFLAAMRFPADDTTEADWLDLLEEARVTWIDFGPAGRQPLHPMPPSPYGLHVLTDREDVLALVKDHSEVIYRYPRRRFTRPAALGVDTAGQDGDAAGTRTRRWWQFGRRQPG